MSQVELIARHTDRLVWAVGDVVRAEQDTFAVSSDLPSDVFGPLLNLIPWRHQLTEDLIRRRYLYRPPAVMDTFISNLEETGLCRKVDDRLVPTDLLALVATEVNAAVDATTHQLWHNHRDEVALVSDLARHVVHAARDRHGLVALAQSAPEAANLFHRCWQHLTALRLVRNEAHVDAWSEFGLQPGDVEVLTDAWAGTKLQAPIVHSENLYAHNLVADGAVTTHGIEVRQQIEDATDAGVAEAYGVIDTAAFLDALRTLPPTD